MAVGCVSPCLLIDRLERSIIVCAGKGIADAFLGMVQLTHPFACCYRVCHDGTEPTDVQDKGDNRSLGLCVSFLVEGL